MAKIDRTGIRYGRWTAICRDPDKRNNWICECDCGTLGSLQQNNLSSGMTKSCGCWGREQQIGSARNLRHGMSGTPTWITWSHMRDRCYNPNATQFKYYGGRGIRVCKRWYRSFEAFFEDMGERPNGMTLDRLDPNGHYMRSNCRWATPAIQANNQRRHAV